MGQLDGAAELARLGEAYFVTQHSYDPYNATLLGVAEFDQLSFDPSREASERAAQELAAIGRAAREIDTAGLTDDQRVDHGVLTALVEGARSDAEHSLWAANASAKSYVSRPARKSSRSPRTHSTALRQYVTPISSTTTFPPASSRRSTRSMRTTPRWRTTGPRPSMAAIRARTACWRLIRASATATSTRRSRSTNQCPGTTCSSRPPRRSTSRGTGATSTPSCAPSTRAGVGWSRQQAIEFMYSHTATTHVHVRNEIDRYIAWPGRALAYVTGRRELVRLRKRAQQTLGPRFDLRRFHHAVLRNGAIPFTLLDDEIERWAVTEA